MKIEEQVFQARLKANEFVQGFLKQLVAVASAAVVLSITFLSDVFGPGTSHSWNPLLYLSWTLLGLSVAGGVIALALLVNNLDVPDQEVGRSGLRKSYAAGTRSDVVLASGASIVLFLLGLVSLATFAAHNVSIPPKPEQHPLSAQLAAIDAKLGAILDLTAKTSASGGAPPATPSTVPQPPQPGNTAVPPPATGK